jgi:hypothetical protein
LANTNNFLEHVCALSACSGQNLFHRQTLSAASRYYFYSAEQRVKERVTELTHDQMMFILGGENIMEPEQTSK